MLEVTETFLAGLYYKDLRVVFRDGSLAPGFAFGGPGAQRALLEAEGVTFLPDGRVDMARHQWTGEDETL